MGKVVVIGSLNHDCIAFVDAFPMPGCTVMADRMLFRHGGKGANQALAAVKQGVPVSLIGCLGDDAVGAEYRKALADHGMDVEAVTIRPGTPSGTALICVNSQAENTIVVGVGTNGTLTADDVMAQSPRLASATILLTQFEVPMPAVIAGIRLAHSLAVATCLNPSPWRPDFPWGEVDIDFVIVNEHEARCLLGREVTSIEDAPWILAKLLALSVHTLVVTRGAASTFAFPDFGPAVEIPVLPVDPVDTVGAGDCFAGVFAARWAEHRDLHSALRAATVAASLSTLEAGAQEAVPSRAQVEEGMKRLGPH